MATPGARPPRPSRAQGDLDVTIAHLLTLGTYVSVALLAVGLAAMVVGGISPYAPAPALDPAGLVGDILAGRAQGFLWVGLLAVMATPAARIVAALIGFARSAEWEMVGVAAAILGVITLSVILARLAEG